MDDVVALLKGFATGAVLLLFLLWTMKTILWTLGVSFP